MKLEVFNELSYDEKLFRVIDKGSFLDNFMTEKIRTNLYALDKFYVELIYAAVENKIIEIRSFKVGIQLDKYASHIKL